MKLFAASSVALTVGCGGVVVVDTEVRNASRTASAMSSSTSADSTFR
jgi:hypothetical protein